MGYELVDLLDKAGEYNRRLREKYLEYPDSVPFGCVETALLATELIRALWAINDKLEELSDGR